MSRAAAPPRTPAKPCPGLDPQLWRAKSPLPDDDDPLRAAKGIGLGLLIMLAVWVGIIAALRWALS